MVLFGAMGGDFMAFFLKKSKLKKGVYLQIYESFYHPEKKLNIWAMNMKR
jgi:hypothetical protein